MQDREILPGEASSTLSVEPARIERVAFLIQIREGFVTRQHRIQLAQMGDRGAVIHQQAGTAGSDLGDLPEEYFATTAEALGGLEAIQARLKAPEYPGGPFQPIDLTRFVPPLSILAEHGLDRLGVTLFMRFDARTISSIISIHEYLRLAPGEAMGSCAAAVRSHLARGQALATMDGPACGLDETHRSGFRACQLRLLSDGLSDQGVTVGYRNSIHQFVYGLPTATTTSSS